MALPAAGVLRAVCAAAVIVMCLGTASGAFARDRIVSVGGDVTEIIFALGYGDRIVATDSTSVYPRQALTTPKVGYVRNLAAEGVLSLEPDLIVISGAAGPRTALEQLRASGVPLLEIPEAYSIEAIVDKTARVARALDEPASGDALIARIEADWADAQSRIAQLSGTPRALFFAAPPDGMARAGGTHTAADAVIRLIGASNVFDTHQGYKALSFEAAVAADPDLILVMAHHAERVGSVDDVVAHPALALTRAAKARRVVLVDPVTVMQFGPRTPAALAALAQAIREATVAHRQ